MGGSISKPSASKPFSIPPDTAGLPAGAPPRGKPRPPKQVRFAQVLRGEDRKRSTPVSKRQVQPAAAKASPDGKAGVHDAQPGAPRLAANLKALVVALHEQEFAEMIDLAKEVASACQRDGVATDAQALDEALRFLLEDPMLDEMQLQSAGRGLLAAALPGGSGERAPMILIANFLAAPGRSAALAPRLEALSQALAAHSLAHSSAQHQQHVARDAPPRG